MLKRYIAGVNGYGFIGEEAFKECYKFDKFVDVYDIDKFTLGTILNKRTILIDYKSNYYQLFVYNEETKIHELANY